MRRVTAVVAATLLVAGLGAAAQPAQANVVVTFTQSATGVDIAANGSLDTGSFGSVVSEYVSNTPGILPRAGTLALAPYNPQVDFYRLAPGVVPQFGPGGGYQTGAWSTGLFMLDTNGSYFDVIELPYNYVSGSKISAEVDFAGATFASLGVDPTQVTATLPGDQRVTYDFKTVSAVPEPAVWVTLLCGVAAVGLRLRRRARRLVPA